MFRIGALLAASAVIIHCQEPVSAGGRWERVLRTDAKTGVQTTIFFLEADAADPDRHPALSIACSDRQKLPLVTYFADIMLDPQIHDQTNYYANAIWAFVKIDKAKVAHVVWDIAAAPSPREAKAAIVDRKTSKQLLGGATMKVRFQAHLGVEFIDSFTIGGLDGEQIRDACGSKWFGK